MSGIFVRGEEVLSGTSKRSHVAMTLMFRIVSLAIACGLVGMGIWRGSASSIVMGSLFMLSSTLYLIDLVAALAKSSRGSRTAF